MSTTFKHDLATRKAMLLWLKQSVEWKAPPPPLDTIRIEYGFRTTDQARALLGELEDMGLITITAERGGKFTFQFGRLHVPIVKPKLRLKPQKAVKSHRIEIASPDLERRFWELLRLWRARHTHIARGRVSLLAAGDSSYLCKLERGDKRLSAMKALRVIAWIESNPNVTLVRKSGFIVMANQPEARCA